MPQSPFATVYRIALADGSCRSALTLLTLRLEGIEGVRAAAPVADDTVVLLAAEEALDLFDRIVEVIIRAGLDPVDATMTRVEAALDTNGLSIDAALALELVRPPKDPVRATPIQRVDVRVNGGYSPDTIILSSQIPTEISFSEGHDCLGRVVFDSLGIEADLEEGGALVSLPALEPGTYHFRCGRDKVRGMLIAE